MGEKYYKISESELLELLHDELTLIALQNGGVDNWSGYGESITHFLVSNGNLNDDIYDIAKYILNEDYEEVSE